MSSNNSDLYSAARDAVAFTTLDELQLHDPVQGREVTFRVHWPAGPGPHPLIVFSHGSVCSAYGYDALTTAWAAQGYAVIAPMHLDALESPPSDGPPDLGKLLSGRIRDMSFALDALPELEGQSGLTGSIDQQRIAAAGHSFGALTALIKTGLTLRAGEYQFEEATHDKRYSAAISMSGVGPLPPFTDDAFAHVEGPVLVSGGTLDEGNVGAGPVFPWEWRMSAYELAAGTDKYSLVIDEADHYFGGLLARADRGGAEDPEGVAILTSITAAFLDAHVCSDAAAKQWLLDAANKARVTDRGHVNQK